MAHPVQRASERPATVHPVGRAVGTAPAPVLRPQRALATTALLLAGAVAAAAVATAVTSFGVQGAVEDVLAGGEAPAMTPYDVSNLVYSALAVLAWVATSAWLYRARVSSEHLSRFVHERSAVWCWLGWAVPVVAWWFPRQVVRDVHRASSPEHAAPRGLDLWWGLFVGGTLVSQAADRLAFSGDELSHLSLLAPLNVAATVMLLGALVVWVRIVTATVRLQEAAWLTPLSQGAGTPLS